jgi:hypothetical protein
MKIRFVITIDDVVALRDFEFFKSDLWRQGNFTQTLVVVWMFVLVGFHFDFLQFANSLGLLLVMIAILLAISLTGELVMRKLASWFLARRTRTLLGCAVRNAVGLHEMELTNWPLVVTTDLAVHWIDPRAISKIVVQARHAFVFLATGESFIIPLRYFPEHETRSFVAALRFAWENRHSGPPTEWRSRRLPPPDEHVQELGRLDVLVTKEDPRENSL